jgi:hypothetical protein
MVIKKVEPSWGAPDPVAAAPAPQYEDARGQRIAHAGLLQAAVQAVAHFAPMLDAATLSKQALELAKELEKRMQEWA